MVWHHSQAELIEAGKILLKILEDYYGDPGHRPILEYRSKAEILEEFPLQEAPEGSRPLAEVLEDFRSRILPLSVKTWHPGFMNQMFAGASFPSIVGDLMASMMNPTLATWEMSPVATWIERSCSRWMARLLGMPAGACGIFLPGGSLSNLMAMTLARHRILGPEVRQKGLPAGMKPVILCSAASHYSIRNAANILGLGTEAVLSIATNQRGEMLPDLLHHHLERLEGEGFLPMAVVATLGLTVTGGFDPLGEMADLCRGRRLHLHADAAFGGGMCLTGERDRLFRGIESVHSVTWDAHKTMHTPLTCSVLLVPDLNELKAAFSHDAAYLFHPQDADELEDLGKFTLLCGKRFDALKIWLLWNTYGSGFFRQMAQERLDLTRAFHQILQEHPHFTPAYEPVSPILCFRFTPYGRAVEPPEQGDRLHREIREAIKQKGQTYINVSALNGSTQFRTILINPLTQLCHLRDLLACIEAEGFQRLRPNPQTTVAGSGVAVS